MTFEIGAVVPSMHLSARSVAEGVPEVEEVSPELDKWLARSSRRMPRTIHPEASG